MSGPIPPDGTLPEEIGKLRELKRLYLFGNQIEGNIPVQLGELRNCVCIDLTKNALTGPIPMELENLKNLTTLYWGNNRLTGIVPQGIFQLPKLEDFSVIYNYLDVDREQVMQDPAMKKWMNVLVNQRKKD